MHCYVSIFRNRITQLCLSIGSSYILTVLWLVTGSVTNALTTKGIRARLYRPADDQLAYYDPCYEEQTLIVYMLFKLRERALQLESQISTNPLLWARRSKDYNPTESESPQGSMPPITEFTYFENSKDESKYRPIEADWVFGPLGKAESSRLISRQQCHKYSSYRKYDDDSNNRLALSRDLHGFYNGLNTQLPVMNITVSSVSEQPQVDGRYVVELLVEVLNKSYRNIIFPRLKPGPTIIYSSTLVAKSSVLVLNPTVFKTWIHWKSKQIDKTRRDYHDIISAVD
ncbi:hypothetical protein SeLEV6574_g05156 [Synchytrium endobioticum]|uniref:Uncharacterized protein n=1 Tax=Synchytrium endobioticum TaxID=286115 RepID=A0A507CVW9_9FUNG|nr:hypothetical protein SeLEV6574_g05156 [Synchytrium endobioticum]